MYIWSYRHGVKTKLLLNAKEAKNSNAGRKKGNIDNAYLPVIGDSLIPSSTLKSWNILAKKMVRIKLTLQINIWKIIYLNCGERREFMIDNCSYTQT